MIKKCTQEKVKRQWCGKGNKSETLAILLNLYIFLERQGIILFFPLRLYTYVMLFYMTKLVSYLYLKIEDLEFKFYQHYIFCML